MDSFIKQWGIDVYNCYFNRDKNRNRESPSPPRYEGFPPPALLRNPGDSGKMDNPWDPFQNELRDIEGNAVPEPFLMEVLDHLQWPEKETYKCDDIDAYIREHGVLNFIVNSNYYHSLMSLLQHRGVANAQRAYIQMLRDKGHII